jgi:hypothetical protein
MSCTILLTKGYIALVDREDYDRLAQYHWHAYKPTGSDRVYAGRWARRGERPDNRDWHKPYPIAMHNEIMGRIEGMRVDHVRPSDTLDNRKSNLRRASAAQNAANSPAPKNNTSGHKGVTWHCSQRWRAFIKFERRQIHLGMFDVKEEAARAYDAAAIRLFGEFAYLNFPDTAK